MSIASTSARAQLPSDIVFTQHLARCSDTDMRKNDPWNIGIPAHEVRERPANAYADVSVQIPTAVLVSTSNLAMAASPDLAKEAAAAMNEPLPTTVALGTPAAAASMSTCKSTALKVAIGLQAALGLGVLAFSISEALAGAGVTQGVPLQTNDPEANKRDHLLCSILAFSGSLLTGITALVTFRIYQQG